MNWHLQEGWATLDHVSSKQKKKLTTRVKRLSHLQDSKGRSLLRATSAQHGSSPVLQ